MATEIESARLMTRWVATLVDEDPDRMLPREASMVKLHVTEVASRAALEGMQMMGGYGYSSEYDMERLVRSHAGLDDLRRHLRDPAQHHRQDPRPLRERTVFFGSASRLGPGFSLVTASVRQRGDMARGDVRIAVTLACEECKRRNYQTNKSRRNSPDRIELRKFCRWCGRHTAHKETR